MVNLFMLASPLYIMNVYDCVLPNAAFDTLWALAIGVVIVYAFDFVMRSLRAHFVDEAGRNADVLMSARIFEHLLGLSLRARPASAGTFASQLREFETVREFISSATFIALVDLPFIIGFLLVIWLVAGIEIALVPAGALAGVVAVGLVLQRPLDRAVADSVNDAARRHGLLVEAIFGLDTIKTQAAEGRLQRHWEEVVDSAAEGSRRMRTLAALNLNMTTLFASMVTVVVVIIGVHRMDAGAMSMGALIAAVILAGRTLAPISQIAALMVRYNQTRFALKTLNRIIALPVERDATRNFVHRPTLTGAIRFESVTFGYPDQGRPALDGVSFDIAAGERVALLGRIGSGKSTLQKLVLGLYHADAGTILVDGTDIRQIDPADLRRNIGYVPQDVFLFSGTVRDNITLGARGAGDAEMSRVAKLTGVDEFIAADPLGYDRMVGERGEQLSVGQRQSIGIARALFGDPPLLLLDEPTSAIDTTSETRILRELQPVVQGKTVLLVTHRLPLLDLVDRVIVIDGGRVVADGAKHEVLQTLGDNARNREAD